MPTALETRKRARLFFHDWSRCGKEAARGICVGSG